MGNRGLGTGDQVKRRGFSAVWTRHIYLVELEASNRNSTLQEGAVAAKPDPVGGHDGTRKRTTKLET